MPILPSSIERAIQNQPKQIKEGEEGILHTIQLNQEHYFAKHWRGKHYKTGSGKESVAYSRETNWKTPVSPFWPKLKFYETQLIHDALPGLIAKIEYAFDPRVSRNGKALDIKKGRPVTVTKDVKGNPNLRKQRDKIVDSMYDNYFKQAGIDERGMLLGSYTTSIQVAKIDRDIQNTFGKYLDVRKHIHTSTFLNKKNVDRFVEKVSQEYHDTDIEKMVRAGVTPIHAELNFIPTKKATDGTIRGVFIEVGIFDLERLADALVQQGVSRALVERRIKRYELLRVLDDMWDELTYPRHGNMRHQNLHEDSDIMTGLFLALDALREKYDKNSIFPNEDILHRVWSLATSVMFSQTKEDALKHLSVLTRWIGQYIRRA
jgi:hypothetical protein